MCWLPWVVERVQLNQHLPQATVKMSAAMGKHSAAGSRAASSHRELTQSQALGFVSEFWAPQ